MAQLYRQLLSEKISRLNGVNVQIPMAALNFAFQKANQTSELFIPIHHLERMECPYNNEVYNSLRESTDQLSNVSVESKSGKKWAKLTLNKISLIQTVLGNVAQKEPITCSNAVKMVVEFSSPNIAKPFHAGHLRSTIIGNFLSNLNDFLGNKVLRLNYLGDWGTQFGYLALGVRLKGLSPEDINKNPIKCLYDAYVHAYQAARDDPSLHTVALDIFSRMEHDTPDNDLQQWQIYRAHTIQELEDLYCRLGVHFSSYEWESQYGVNKIAQLIETLERHGILHNQTDGRKVVQLKARTIPIVKSDGTGMYLLRDIAALMDRQERYHFEKCFYVVENGQTDHFASLKEIAHMLGLPYATGIEHIKFGRIHGMSTRRGKVIFLKDILHEAQQLVLEKQRESPYTKTNTIDNPEVCDILGTSAVIINDLKQRRMKDYNFDWSKVLRMEGDSGIKLQYTHCRLASLLDNAHTTADEILQSVTCDGASLLEPEAVELVCMLANFQPVCHQAHETAEACILVAYLFRLCKAINLGLKALPVKHETDRKRRLQRLLLFSRAKSVLHSGMKLLGLRPLEKM
ncbi:uncharacterized protein LOC128726412 [Anopheles nili]|uniref:uncharacterized protein LOC128726412 n=1 Tax=Anopheles nili TaxID=185578 RepID=UPI00237B3517|nr:uncharacterized protein LOC128726412 [Anopheles nili]